MSETILVGQGHQITKISRAEWESILSHVKKNMKARLNFMSGEHHLVGCFVVRELPNVEEPLFPEVIARELNLPVARVNVILEDLEKHMTFLFRNGQGAVVWAYPVTVDTTPHHITFKPGEKLYAA